MKVTRRQRARPPEEGWHRVQQVRSEAGALAHPDPRAGGKCVGVAEGPDDLNSKTQNTQDHEQYRAGDRSRRRAPQGTGRRGAAAHGSHGPAERVGVIVRSSEILRNVVFTRLLDSQIGKAARLLLLRTSRHQANSVTVSRLVLERCPQRTPALRSDCPLSLFRDPPGTRGTSSSTEAAPGGTVAPRLLSDGLDV